MMQDERDELIALLKQIRDNQAQQLARGTGVGYLDSKTLSFRTNVRNL